MLLLLGALVGFAVYSEIHQRNRASGEKLVNQTMQAEEAGTMTPRQSREARQNEGLRTIDINLLAEAGWGNTERVKLLLDTSADVNARDAKGDTPLIVAALLGFGETVEVLLERGADINAKNNLGNTALMEAAAMNRPETVGLLLSKGADTRGRNIAGLTAMDVAVRENHPQIVNLLKSGAVKSPNQPAPFAALDAGLHQAVIKGDINKIRSLIADGANVNARGKDGWTA
jgi:ankyrin repeat protein